MTQTPAETGTQSVPEKSHQRSRTVLGELKEKNFWFVRLRWLVPPGIVAGIGVAKLAGGDFETIPLLWVAVFILIYNVILYPVSCRLRDESYDQTKYINRFTYCQIAFDYIAMFLLIHFTGGAASPLIFFFIFHIIFASIFLPTLSAYGFAALAAAGTILIVIAEYLGWIPHHPLIFQGRTIDIAEQPFYVMVELGFFTASLFIAVFSITAVININKRILDMGKLSETVASLDIKLKVLFKLDALFTMIQAIGSTRSLDQVLNIATNELAPIMDVCCTSVKLLSEDGKFLRYAAAHGLREESFKDKVVEVAKIPLHRRIIDGESFVTGKVTPREWFQFGGYSDATDIESVLFVPLTLEDRVIGILGAYCTRPERFSSDDVDFLRLAAGLVAIAIENARAYEEIKNLTEERSRFMLRVAHSLRAPLTAMLNILEVVLGGYRGELNDVQKDYLNRVNRRGWTMASLIDELMSLAESKSEKLRLKLASIDLKTLAKRVQRTFQDEAAKRDLSFTVTIPENLPEIQGDEEMIEQMIENLVSNAIKYTYINGQVDVTFSESNEKTILIKVKDTGIGISKSDMDRLFTEFFRAENARSIEEVGTGLGLAIVKEIVDKHGGRISVASEEGEGTVFTVHLPRAQGEKNSNE